jgi:hypothetical protein
MTNLLDEPRPVSAGEQWLEEGLIHKTRRGEAVRSRSEVIIADALFANDVPYVYEQPLAMPGGSRRLSDFTVEDRESGVSVYWEHLGLTLDAAYRRRWEEKQDWYRRNGILPREEGGGTNGTLVVTEDSPRGGIDSGAIDALVNEVFGR